jgi:hypothetical protein
MYFNFTDNVSNIQAYYTKDDISIPYDDVYVPIDKNNWVIKDEEEIFSMSHSAFVAFYSPSDSFAREYVDQVELDILDDELKNVTLYLGEDGILSFHQQKLTLGQKMKLIYKLYRNKFEFSIRM